MATYEEKRLWVLEYLQAHDCAGTFDEDFHEAYWKRFGGKRFVYTFGPNRCPGAVRLLRRMWIDGDLTRSVVGNQEARYNCQPTWCLVYRLADSPCGLTYERWYSKQRRWT